MALEVTESKHDTTVEKFNQNAGYINDVYHQLDIINARGIARVLKDQEHRLQCICTKVPPFICQALMYWLRFTLF